MLACVSYESARLKWGGAYRWASAPSGILMSAKLLKGKGLPGSKALAVCRLIPPLLSHALQYMPAEHAC
jgi:hypothetical protein